ncbi:hypothetical protein PLESTM_001312000 [Pleodorina starrii]|nr:hypothetical protein PLESTM_001312000 [Pleodorina starrii]
MEPEAVLKIGQHCKALSEKYPEYDIYPEDKSKAEKSVLLLWEARFRSTLDQPAMQLAYLLDPVNFIKDKGTAEWCLPWSQFTLEQRQRMRQLAAEVFAGAGIGSTEGEKEKDKQDKMAVLFAEWGLILLMDVPEECSDYMPTLVRRTEVTVGEQTKVEIAGLPLRLKFWRLYMASTYPALAYVANRVLRLHATTCAAERDWSLWGRDLSQKAQERAEKLTYVRQNDDSNTSKCSALTDEEVVMDLLHGSDDDE